MSKRWGRQLALATVSIMLIGCGAQAEGDGLGTPDLAQWVEDEPPAPTETESSTPGEATTPTETATFAEDPGNLLDLDRDGFTTAEGDCDDTNPAISPAEPERCGDRVDNDCDRFTDEPSAIDARRFYVDDDGDGFGDTLRYLTLCEAVPSFVPHHGDCDDTDPTVHPEAIERCEDGLDSDCDGGDNTSADGAGCER